MVKVTIEVPVSQLGKLAKALIQAELFEQEPQQQQEEKFKEPEQEKQPDEEPAVSLETLRSEVMELAKASKANKTKVKAKLFELGAGAVSELPEGSYGEFYNFLQTL
jgi:replication initiation and membrane attachment protein DnaB